MNIKTGSTSVEYQNVYCIHIFVLCTFCISKNANWVFNTSPSCKANVGAIDKYPNWPKPVLEKTHLTDYYIVVSILLIL